MYYECLMCEGLTDQPYGVVDGEFYICSEQCAHNYGHLEAVEKKQLKECVRALRVIE